MHFFPLPTSISCFSKRLFFVTHHSTKSKRTLYHLWAPFVLSANVSTQRAVQKQAFLFFIYLSFSSRVLLSSSLQLTSENKSANAKIHPCLLLIAGRGFCVPLIIARSGPDLFLHLVSYLSRCEAWFALLSLDSVWFLAFKKIQGREKERNH